MNLLAALISACVLATFSRGPPPPDRTELPIRVTESPVVHFIFIFEFVNKLAATVKYLCVFCGIKVVLL